MRIAFIGGTGEDHKEGVALGAQLDAFVGGDGGAHEPALIVQDIGPVVSEFLEQAGGTLDVREKEGDGASRAFRRGGPLAEALAGKTVVSAVVPMAFEQGRASLFDVPEGSAAQQAQALLPESTVVGAFQNLSARKLLRDRPIEADVVVCADDADAKRRIMDLAADISGVRGIDGGELANAKVVEAITVLLVSINRAYKTQAGIRIAGVE